MGLVISTSWNAYRYTNGSDLLFEIKNLGFEEIELSFNLTASMVAGIQETAGLQQIKIMSLHNFCPVPEELARNEALPDCYSMSSINEEERQLAIKYTKRTIQAANLLGAKAVILHCGRVDVPDRTIELIQLYEKGLKQEKDFKDLKADIIKEREAVCKPFLDNTLNSLEELAAYAQKKNVFLGIETRFYHREIPTLEELAVIFEKFPGANICYWHDTGHAQVMENLGFALHKDYLELYAKYMLGIHLHDVSGCKDHKAPGKGELDFHWLKPFLKKETIKVIEAHHPATADDLKESKEYLESVFHGVI
jgi:sugar phosphate isomerase/epimerase